jgi:hypothetical protein
MLLGTHCRNYRGVGFVGAISSQSMLKNPEKFAFNRRIR